MATLTVYTARDGRRYGVLSGGNTAAYGKIDGRWFESVDPENLNESGDNRKKLAEQATAHGLAMHEYAWSFAHVYIAADVESIGDYAFAYFENADFTFEAPENIKHLGVGAFACTAIRSVRLPGLQDETLAEIFSGCSKLEEVDLTGSKVTAIAAKAFRRCHKLKRVLGCDNVTSIGELAFSRCPSLMYIEVEPRVLKTVGYAAFHISGLGDRLNGFKNTAFGPTARRVDKFDAQTLEAIRAEELSDVGELPQTVCEQSYSDLKYATTDGKLEYIADGCMMLSLYHVYQRMFPDSGFESFPEWWDYVDGLCVEAEGTNIYKTERLTSEDTHKILYLVLRLLGLTLKDFEANTEMRYPFRDKSWPYYCGLMTHDEAAKHEIWQALASGYGVLASISTGEADDSEKFFLQNHHMVAIVGCRNGKLLVVDSASIDGERGGVYEVAYEDLFIGAGYARNRIWVIMPGEVSA